MKCTDFMKCTFRRYSVPLSAGAITAASAAPAFADSTSLIDFSTLATAVQTDVTAAITAMLPFLGLLCGAVVGWRIFRKFTGARP